MRFQSDLGIMEPADITAFLSHADATWPLSVLFIMALLWSPLAVRLFAKEVAQHTEHLTADHLGMALHATVRGIDQIAQDGGQEWHQHLAQDAILAEQGLQQQLGTASVVRFLKVAEPAPATHKALCRLSSHGPGLKLIQNHERCQKLLQALPFKLDSKCTTWKECESCIQDVQGVLAALPSWANHPKTRIHVLLRLALLWGPSADQHRAISSHMMELVSTAHLRAHIPVHWDVYEAAALVGEQHPLMLDTWMSFLQNAFQDKQARDWFTEAEAPSLVLMAVAAQLREENYGINPTLSKVIAHAAEAWFGNSRARKAGTNPTKVTEHEAPEHEAPERKATKRKATKHKATKGKVTKTAKA